MTLARRILACVETESARLKSGPQDHRGDSGDPAELAGHLCQEGADELVVIETRAAQGGRTAFLELVRRLAAQLPIPLTAGGGIHSIADARAVLRAGADRVMVNSAAVRAPQLIDELSAEFGAESLVLAVDARRVADAWEVFFRGGQEATGRDAVAWAREGSERGAGEILVTALDRKGTRDGYDTALTAAVSAQVSVPVTASGGAGTPDDFLAAFTEGRADAAMAASIFHHGDVSIRNLKQYLDSRGVLVRI